MNGRGDDEVELVEDDPLDEPAGSPPVRHRGRWIALAGALVVVLLVQGGLDLRDRRRLEQLREVPGVVGPIGATLAATWRLPDGAVPLDLVAEPPISGTDLVLVARTADDGSVSVQGRAPEDGALRWSTDVLGADEQRARNALMPTIGLDCAGMGDEALLGCVVFDQDVEVLGDAIFYQGTRSAAVLLLDLRDGRVVGRTDLPDPSSAAADVTAVDGLLVTRSGTDTLWAWRPGQREPRWRLDLDPVDGGSSSFLPLPGAVAWVRGGQVEIVGPDGSVLRGAVPVDDGVDGVGPMCLTAAGTVACPRGDGGTVVVGPDVELRLDGVAIRPVADDGSVPGLLLTEADGVLMAWDASTGEALWRGGSQRSLAVLDGRVYVLGSPDVSALDGRTGDVLWRRAAPTQADALVTDGRVLLPLQTWTGGTAQAPTLLLRLSDGTDAGMLSRPDEEESIGWWVAGHRLYGYGDRLAFRVHA